MAVSQGFIQPIAQDAQRTIPNNGNPNTVYNTAPTGAAVTGWAANPITPAANYNGTNAAQAITDGEAAIANGGWVAPVADPNVKQGQGVLQLPAGWADKIQNFTPSAPAPAAPAAPAYDLNKQWTVMDGKTPRKNNDLYNSDPAYRAAWDQIFAEHNARMGKSIEDSRSDTASMNAALQGYYKMYYDNGWRPDTTYIQSGGKHGNIQGVNSTSTADTYAPYDNNTRANNTGALTQNRLNPSTTGPANAGGGGGSGASPTTNYGLGSRTLDSGTVSSAMNHLTQTSEPRTTSWNSDTGKSVSENLNTFYSNAISSLGKNATADSVMKVLDAITEPFLPGNMYMSELGKLNTPNVLAAIMNKALPGVGTLGKWLVDKIPDNATGLLGKLRDWVRNGKFEEAANEIYKQYDMEKAQNIAIGGGGGGGGDGNYGGGGGYGGGQGWVGTGGGGSGGRTGSVTVGPMKNPDIKQTSSN
ncbi:hypothetical protein [Stenotrophomonas phage StenR_269]|nr:hypothetical protein [Stenotrophomonas phage StenR_269]